MNSSKNKANINKESNSVSEIALFPGVMISTGSSVTNDDDYEDQINDSSMLDNDENDEDEDDDDDNDDEDDNLVDETDKTNKTTELSSDSMIIDDEADDDDNDDDDKFISNENNNKMRSRKSSKKYNHSATKLINSHSKNGRKIHSKEILDQRQNDSNDDDDEVEEEEDHVEEDEDNDIADDNIVEDEDVVEDEDEVNDIVDEEAIDEDEDEEASTLKSPNNSVNCFNNTDEDQLIIDESNEFKEEDDDFNESNNNNGINYSISNDNLSENFFSAATSDNAEQDLQTETSTVPMAADMSNAFLSASNAERLINISRTKNSKTSSTRSSSTTSSSSASSSLFPSMPQVVTHVGRKPLNGPPCSLKTLVDDGILEPLDGSLTYEIMVS